MKVIVISLSLAAFAFAVPQSAHASRTYKTKRIPPRESCGNAANEYCVDVTNSEVPCGTRAAEWKICVYAGDEGSLEKTSYEPDEQ